MNTLRDAYSLFLCASLTAMSPIRRQKWQWVNLFEDQGHGRLNPNLGDLYQALPWTHAA